MERPKGTSGHLPGLSRKSAPALCRSTDRCGGCEDVRKVEVVTVFDGTKDELGNWSQHLPVSALAAESTANDLAVPRLSVWCLSLVTVIVMGTRVHSQSPVRSGAERSIFRWSRRCRRPTGLALVAPASRVCQWRN